MLLVIVGLLILSWHHESINSSARTAKKSSLSNEDFELVDASAAKKHLRPVILEPLKAVRDSLAELPQWTKESVAAAVAETAKSFEINMGKLGQPIRVAVTGGGVSPPIDTTVYLVGRARTLKRLDHAIALIEARAALAQP